MGPNPHKTVDMVTFTEEILDRKFIFCAVNLRCSQESWIRLWEMLMKIVPVKNEFYSKQMVYYNHLLQ